jgi:recombinational DNA repair protein RecR
MSEVSHLVNSALGPLYKTLKSLLQIIGAFELANNLFMMPLVAQSALETVKVSHLTMCRKSIARMRRRSCPPVHNDYRNKPSVVMIHRPRSRVCSCESHSMMSGGYSVLVTSSPRMVNI